MALRFIGVDPDTGKDHSPTVWVDPETADIVVQGWEADAATLAEVAAAPAPEHVPGVPAGEAVIRIPARMVSALREACDVAESASSVR
jgi:hypothetical protein